MSTTSNQLWYRQPAANWNQALPLGNGRMGAMAFGDARDALFQLNEDTLWTGLPGRYENPAAPEAFQKARRLALDGQLSQAQKVLEEEFLTALWSQLYMPLGDLRIRMSHGEAQAYRRELNLGGAVHKVKYTADGVAYARESFISYPDQVMAVRITADAHGSVTFTASLTPAMEKTDLRLLNRDLVIMGHCPVVRHTPGKGQDHGRTVLYGDLSDDQGVGYCARLRVVAEEGRVDVDREGIHVKGANAATVYLCVRTSFNGWDKHPTLDGKEYLIRCLEDLNAAAGMAYLQLRLRHVLDFSARYDRVYLDLGCNEDLAALPTDERLLRHHEGERDNSLYTLFFNYARYLTLSASREGTQPMNLQGIWSNSLTPPWNCNYTLNINTEMNYWPTLGMNLPECAGPLVALIGDLTASGRWTARHYYGAQGAVAHHNTDLWRMTTPVGAGCSMTAEYGFWPMGLMWLCRGGWDYYRYTLDRRALVDVIYPAIRECARFLLDTLVLNGDGQWIFAPGTSPEHWYGTEGGQGCAVDETAAMCSQIVRDVFDMCLQAEEELEIDDLSTPIRPRMAQLPPIAVDGEGRIREWAQDRPDGEKHHRHMSHLYGLYPARQIVPQDLRLMTAARRTMESRGDEGTGWSKAWKICLWARLLDGEKALQLLDEQLAPAESAPDWGWQSGGTYPNLLDAHPPFQIDGNFGAAAGILEMLYQEDEKTGLHLLPALPKSWHTGELRGALLPGNKVLDMRWEKGKLIRAVILQPDD